MGFSLKSPIFQYLALPGTFAPAIAAFIVRKWVTRESFGDAGLKPNLKPNGGITWWHGFYLFSFRLSSSDW
jgi:hypothetical protein